MLASLSPTSSLAPSALPSTQAVPTRLPRPPHALLLPARALLLPAHALLLLAHALPPFPALALALFPLGASVAVTSTLALPLVSLATAVAARVSGTLSAFHAKWPSPRSCARRARSIFHISGSSKYWAVTGDVEMRLMVVCTYKIRPDMIVWQRICICIYDVDSYIDAISSTFTLETGMVSRSLTVPQKRMIRASPPSHLSSTVYFKVYLHTLNLVQRTGISL
jgi:hypothetical protein